MNNKFRNMILAVAAVTAFAAPALAESAICTVTAPELRLRKSPSMKARVVAVLKKDQRVTTAKECSGGWVKISSEDGKLSGYVGGWALAIVTPKVAEPAQPEAKVVEATYSVPAYKEVPSNEKLAMQITDLRLNMLGIERDMQQMGKEIKKIKVALKKRNIARK